MLSSRLEFLQSPHLVVAVQEFFGVRYLAATDEDAPATMDDGQRGHGAGGLIHKRNISNSSSDEGFNDATASSSSDSGTRSDDMMSGCTAHHAATVDSKLMENPLSSSSPSVASEAIRPYAITNRFWYYLFVLATELGDEIFYATMIPFWFWNIDGAVGRRVVFVWSVVMYIGQSAKDVIRWPRPGRPVHRLQQKWGLEYGMPSTHAMVAVAMPFSVVAFMADRYVFSVTIGVAVATVWCTAICLSRLYLGMHSVLDIIAGLVLTVLLMIPLVPLVDALDPWLLSSGWSPLCVFVVSVLLIWFYPSADKWTPTRGDTTMTVSVCAGLQIGSWLNYQLGTLRPPDDALPPYAILWPSYAMIGLMLLRTVLGLCAVLATRAIGKSLSYAVVCAALGRDANELRRSENSLQNRDKIAVELCYKYFACAMIGFNTVALLPQVFRLLGIGRPDFHTEM